VLGPARRGGNGGGEGAGDGDGGVRLPFGCAGLLIWIKSMSDMFEQKGCMKYVTTAFGCDLFKCDTCKKSKII
jgi:hypothetical protein